MCEAVRTARSLGEDTHAVATRLKPQTLPESRSATPLRYFILRHARAVSGTFKGSQGPCWSRALVISMRRDSLRGERVSISSKRGFHSLRRSQNASKEQTSCDLFGAGPPVAFLSFQLFLCALAHPPDPSNSSGTVMQHHLRASTGGILQGSRWQTQNSSSYSFFISD